MTTIEWTDETWNPIRGCSRVSEGCRNCYAEIMAARFSRPGQWGEGLAKIIAYPDGTKDHRWTGVVQMAPYHVLEKPLSWRTPRMVFVNSTSDLFHGRLSFDDIDRVFAVMALTPRHIYQVLTKRPDRMREYSLRRNESGHHPAMDYTALTAATGRWNTPALDLRVWPLPNVWLGVSVEDQAMADERVRVLLDTPAAVRFVSAEPLLGPVDLTQWLWGPRATCGQCSFDADCECNAELRSVIEPDHALHWVIVGGESGPVARPMHPDWTRSLRDQCAAAGVAFFFKQWGAHAVVYDRDHDDPDWQRCDAVKRKTPKGRWLNLAGGHGFHGDRVVRVAPVSKTRAGRLLDGRLHDGMPGGAEQ